MDENLAAVLAKRLAAYSAAAGVALACGAPAEAQIVYHDLKPDPNLTIGIGGLEVVTLDFDDDGADDLELIVCDAYNNYGDCIANPVARYYTYQVGFRPAEGAPASNGVFGYDAPDYQTIGVGGASRLSSGFPVGVPVTGRGFYPNALAAVGLGGCIDYPFCGAEGYAGFRFVGGDGALHYGWIRLFVNDGADAAVLYEWAYEATPETPIAAGAYEVALRGSVGRRRFPPEGGRLRGTAVFENNTVDPLPLDFWLEVERGGTVYLSTLLGSDTLPAGATVSRGVSLMVPADLRPGPYLLTFKVGDYDTGRHRSLQQFKITVAPSSTEAADEGEPHAPSVEGRGHVEAEGATGVAGTHALSAPAPNPADGRAVLTLQVAEAQRVTVAVHDALGRRVASLHDGPLAAGEVHRLVFDGASLPAGVYVVRAVGEAFSDTRVLSLTR